MIHMSEGDFFSSERSTVMGAAAVVRIEHVDRATGAVTVLKPKTPLQAGEVIDASRMSAAKLCALRRASVPERPVNSAARCQSGSAWKAASALVKNRAAPGLHGASRRSASPPTP